MRYLSVVYQILNSMEDGNLSEVRDFANELCNLVMDHVSLSDVECETAGDYANDLGRTIRENGYNGE